MTEHEAILMEIPGPRPRTSIAYLIEDLDGGLHLIDCGADTPANRAALQRVIAGRGRRMQDLQSVTGTHAHFDHVGMAPWITGETGARFQLHALDALALRDGTTYGGPQGAELAERWGVPEARRPEFQLAVDRRVASGERVEVDRELTDGDDLGIPGRRFTVIWTPGHTAGHISVVDEETRDAYVGDHILGAQYPAVGLGGPVTGNPVAMYLDALERVRAVEPARLLPGHAPVIPDPESRIAATRRHQLRRRVEALTSAEMGGTIWDIAARMRWSTGWDGLNGVRLFSAVNQVQHHLAFAGVGGRR